MKKIFFLIVALFSVALLFSQPVQAADCIQPVCGQEVPDSAICPNNTTAWATYNTCMKANADAGTISIPRPQGALTDINRILSAGIQLILIAAGLIAFVYLLLGGIAWITSGGDKAGVEKARNQIIQALIGLIVVLAAWGLIAVVEKAAAICLGFSCAVQIPEFFSPR